MIFFSFEVWNRNLKRKFRGSMECIRLVRKKLMGFSTEILVKMKKALYAHRRRSTFEMMKQLL